MRIWLFAQDAVFLQIRCSFLKNMMFFFWKIVKSMPAIVICSGLRGHETSKTQCLHRLCVELDPPTPKTLLKMRRCYADLIVCSGRSFFAKSIQVFDKYDVFFEESLNPCQPSWFAVVCEATKRQKLNVCTDFVFNLTHPRQNTS